MFVAVDVLLLELVLYSMRVLVCRRLCARALQTLQLQQVLCSLLKLAMLPGIVN